MAKNKIEVSPDVLARNVEYLDALTSGNWEPESSEMRKKKQHRSEDKKGLFLKALAEFAPNLPEPMGGTKRSEEFHPIPGRDHSCDWAWPQWGIVVEVDGGTWVNGRHSRDSDYWKINEITALGYTVFRFTTSQLRRRDTAAECVGQLLYFLKSKGYIK